MVSTLISSPAKALSVTERHSRAPAYEHWGSTMQHSYIDSSNHEFKHPICAKCGTPMWLTGIEPYEPDYDQRTFERSGVQQ